jgi:hypothetical protein
VARHQDPRGPKQFLQLSALFAASSNNTRARRASPAGKPEESLAQAPQLSCSGAKRAHLFLDFPALRNDQQAATTLA